MSSATTDRPRRRPGRVRRRTALVAALGAAVLLVGAAVISIVLLNQQRTPLATAQEYFDALAAGDATTANRLADLDPASSTSYRFLTDDVLGAAVERISEVEIHEDPYDETRARVSFALAGEVHYGEVHLVPGEPDWGVLRTWRIDDAFAANGHVVLFADVTAQVAGVAINPEGRSGWAMMYPGVYPFDLGDEHWLEPVDPQFVVSPDDFPSEIQVAPTDELRAEATTRAEETLAACAMSVTTAWHEREDDPCPLRTLIGDAVDPHGSWEIVRFPDVEVALAGRALVISGGETRFTSVDGTVVTAPVETWQVDIETTPDGVTLVG